MSSTSSALTPSTPASRSTMDARSPSPTCSSTTCRPANRSTSYPGGPREAPLHAAGKRGDTVVLAVGELEQGQRLVDTLLHQVRRQVEVAAVHAEVLPHREVGVQVVVLRHDAQSGLDATRLPPDVHPVDGELARGHGRDAGDHPDGGCLAGPVKHQGARVCYQRVANGANARDKTDGGGAWHAPPP